MKCSSEDFKYDSVVLLSSNSEPIVLSNLDFACYYPKGFCASLIAFFSDSAISVTSKFGETIGIPLKTHCEDALEPNHSDLFYTMSFEKVSLPAVVLQKLLETKRNRRVNRTRKPTNSFALIHHKRKPLTARVDGFFI